MVVLVHYLYRAKQKEPYLADIKIAEFILLMGHKCAKVATYKAVPESLVLLCGKTRPGYDAREYERKGESVRCVYMFKMC